LRLWRDRWPPELSRSEPFVAAVVFAAALTVMLATKIGMPISTTHSLTGALCGIAVANGQAHWKMIRTILLAWLLTLPTAALLSAGIYSLSRSF
jgi:phosphate/sulfate permease